MKSTRKKKGAEATELICGLFSKKEAALRIASGARHLHSSILGERDACARISAASLKRGEPQPYPWEQVTPLEEFRLSSSAERYQFAAKIIQNPLVTGKRKIRERLEVILEELLTNSLYHAYRNDRGEEKYPRKAPVQLSSLEALIIRYSLKPEGIFLSIEDRGGNFSFESITSAFQRCYATNEDAHQMIEGKQGGAGLGLYMVFEAATHFKVVCNPGKHTMISVWISDRKGDDVDNFSFNYFTVKE